MKAPAVDDVATENISAQRAHEHAVRTKLISATRPGTSASELDASEVLLKRDGKDIYKKSAARRNRYAMVFPGQLSALKEGRLGEMREMHTQEPVVYLDFPNGRLKLLGTIVRPKTTRYFTLNAKSKDRMNMEEWFDNVIVFSSWFWIGTREENPEEKPLALPASLGDLSGEPEVDWESSVAADAGKTSTKAPVAPPPPPTTTDVKTIDGEKADTAVESNGRRPRRQAATVARKKMYADDSDADVDDEDSDEDDNRIASPVVVRGKVESFIPTVPVAAPKAPVPVRQSVTAPVRSSAAAASGRSSLSAPKAPPAKRTKKEQPIVIDSDDDDDDDDDDIEDDSEDEDAMDFDDDSEDDDDGDDDDSDSDF